MLSETSSPDIMQISPAGTSSENDFDFLVGKWKVHNRRLRLAADGAFEWVEFPAEIHMRKTLNGLGNVENYYAVIDEKVFEGQAVRLFHPQTRLWTIYWIDSNNMTMDQHPVTGSFENAVGNFYCRLVENGLTIIMVYRWDVTDPGSPRWSQATSIDNGETWKWDWKMQLTRIS